MIRIVIKKLPVCQLVKKLVTFTGILYPLNFKPRIADTPETVKFNPHDQHVFLDNFINILTPTPMSSKWSLNFKLFK